MAMIGSESTFDAAQSLLFCDKGPRVFTIPPAASFLDVLAHTLVRELDGRETPFALSDAIILLPTKRAARALAEAFLNARDGAATLLPRIRTIGDIDPDDAGLAELGEGLALTPTIEPMARRLTLARLIRARDKQVDWAGDPVAALSAADALAELLDSAAMTSPTNQPFDWSALNNLVEDKNLALHWEQSTTFLQIVTQMWPRYLAELDRADPGVRQRRGIEGLIETWKSKPPKGAVILAGSTGSMPITRDLMACVARLATGCVVLPGLDKNLSDANWAHARHDDQHPQRAMAQALETISITRNDVKIWPGAVETSPLSKRREVINEALTPSEATADWPTRIKEIGAEDIALGLQGLSLVEASTEEEEASIIALELRQSLEQEGQTAALVTPDAYIARRVAAKLAKWGIVIDVSAGKPLGDTQVGAFVRLVAAWAIDPADPVALVGLLGHPLTCAGFERAWLKNWAHALEINFLRGARKDIGLSQLRTRIAAFEQKRLKSIGKTAPSDGLAMLASLVTALEEIVSAFSRTPATLDLIAANIAQLCEALASTPSKTGASTLWVGEDGEAAGAFIAGLMAHGDQFDTIEQGQGARTITYLMQAQVVRPRGTHAQLAILGPLEARLLRFDKVVLAGLDEGVWPKPASPDPFLSRDMRAKLKLPSPDSRIGLSAHDFAQLGSAPIVVMTRAKRRGDAPVVMSRWLWRLKTLTRGALGLSQSEKALEPSPNWRDILRHNEPSRTFETALAIPRPKPPLYARPIEFSATQIETWIRDPYRTYIEKVLQLRALDPLGGPPGVGERGTAIHTGTEVVEAWHKAAPKDATGDLSLALRQALVQVGYQGTLLEREMSRLEASIEWLAPYEIERLSRDWFPHIEQWGQITLDTLDGPLTIKAKSDRIDVGPEGLEVLDFKSGTPSTPNEIMAMFGAQLPVTALIISRGGYKDIPARIPTDLAHIRLGGRKVGIIKAVHHETSVEALVEKAEQTLIKLFHKYNDPAWPYLSKPRVKFTKKVSYDEPSDRLARRTEWADVEGDGS